MSSDEDSKYVSLYRELAPLQVLKEAEIVNNGNIITCHSEWTGRNVATLKPMSTSCHQCVMNGSATPAIQTPLPDNLVSTAREGDYTAHLTQSETDKPVTRHITILRTGCPPVCIDLANTKLHGKVYTDDELGCLTFSPDCLHLAYVAEEYRPEPKSFFAAASSTEEKNSGRGEEFVWRPDWGEQYTGCSKNVLIIVPCKNSAVDDDRYLLTPPSEYASIGKIVWAGPRTLLGVAYFDASPRLGLIYCPNRESVLFSVNIDNKKFVEIVPRGHSVSSPRLSPDLSLLVFLRGPIYGPHCREAQLVARAWGSDPDLSPSVSCDVIVDYVEKEQELDDGTAWSGLTGMTSLPAKCFLFGGRAVALNTCSRFALKCHIVMLDTRKVFTITLLDDKVGSERVLDVCPDGNLLLMSSSSFSRTSSLDLARAVLHNGHVKVEHVCVLVGGQSVPGVPSDWIAQWILQAVPPHPLPQYDAVPIPIIYCGPTNKPKGTQARPLIVFPHGGPHAISMNAFSIQMAMLVSAGYSVVLPNFRGSLGLGSAGIHSLAGHCGNIDVKDCHAAAVECLNRFSEVLDAKNVFLFGGSHGGFLVLSLSAIYPDFYRAVCARNPVSDLSTLSGISDIPDWAHYEACRVDDVEVPKLVSSAPSVESLARMAAMSPIRLVDCVKAPTLLQLGSEDRRVIPSQGIKYHELLKHRGVPTSVLMYPDCHPLRKVPHEADAIIHTLRWFKRYKAL